MTTPDARAAVLDDLEWRRMMADHTDLDDLRSAMRAAPLTFYGGFDPTAPSLHFGNLVLLVTMRRLQLAGHRPIGLVGGATGLVGDPSGRTSERTLNEREVVASWVERIRSQVARYLDFDGDNGALIVNNLDWTGAMSAIDWLRDIGKHFSVNRMLAKEAVSARLEAGGISYTEFSYQIMQAVDFLELYRRHGCTLQLGGSDQWGNLTAGVDLIRRVEGATAHALATPLITRPDGEKFGKSTGSTLWLDPALTSPFAFYQWFLNTDDAVVGTYLRVFSFRTHDEISALEASVAERPETREAQRALAAEVTELVHGADAAAAAAEASRALFGQAELHALDAETLAAAFADLPRAALTSSDGLPAVVDLLVATGLVESRGQARRVVSEGGAYVNNERVTDPAFAPDRSRLLAGRWLLVRRGKRNLAVAEVEPT
ncbi:MAG TPA: tyrosine--tRNA ligase [Candidatus Limnocylindria bacterium]|jgi:tyrosyl-tRNA synthetase|nr:tyrosine--tRNA ligase [Candidatus Limnocylindria bacterium]